MDLFKRKTKLATIATARWATIIGLPLLSSVPFMAYYYYMHYLPRKEHLEIIAAWRRPIRTTPLFVAGGAEGQYHHDVLVKFQEDSSSSPSSTSSSSPSSITNSDHNNIPEISNPQQEADNTRRELEKRHGITPTKTTKGITQKLFSFFLEDFIFNVRILLRIIEIAYRSTPVVVYFLTAYYNSSGRISQSADSHENPTISEVTVAAKKDGRNKNNTNIMTSYRHITYTDAYDALRNLFTSLGPTYIKLGQWMATRPDLFPQELCYKLSQLFDSAPVHDWAFTEKILRRGFQEEKEEGKSVSGIPQDCILFHLSSIERVPINSGSVAQVYKAILRHEIDGLQAGTELAIKVLHPNVRRDIWLDICALKVLTKVFSFVVPRSRYLDPRVHWHEFASLLISQVNLVREAENLLEFRYFFRDFQGGFVSFPKPIIDLCNPDVLVETFEKGHPLQDVEASKPLADLGVRMFLKMIFEDNFVHADLHPGNILVRVRHSDGTIGLDKRDHRCRNEIVVLDTGLVTSLAPKDRENFLMLFSAVASGDSDMAAELMLERSPNSKECVDQEAFRAEMREVFDIVAPSDRNRNAANGDHQLLSPTSNSAVRDGGGVGFQLGKIEMGEVLGKILTCMRHHKVAIDGHFATLVMTVIVGEGLGRRMHPDYNLFQAAAPYLVQSLSSREMGMMVANLKGIYNVA